MDGNEDPDATKRTARSDIPRPHECATRREAITPTVDPYVRRAEQRRRVRTTRTVGRQTRSRASVTSRFHRHRGPNPPCRFVAAAPSPPAAQRVAEAAGYSGWVARAVLEMPGGRRAPPAGGSGDPNATHAGDVQVTPRRRIRRHTDRRGSLSVAVRVAFSALNRPACDPTTHLPKRCPSRHRTPSPSEDQSPLSKVAPTAERAGGRPC
jgi:hypothetical protein